MNSDVYTLFTECHRLYIQGMRIAVRERLEAVHSDEWWTEGVLTKVATEQRKQLERLENGQSQDTRETLLDAPHFSAVICRSNSFADAFNDLSTVFHKFRRLSTIRNAWAHVQMDNISSARVIQSLEIMEEEFWHR